MGMILAILIAVIGVVMLLAALVSTGQAKRVALMLLCWTIFIIGAGWLIER